MTGNALQEWSKGWFLFIYFSVDILCLVFYIRQVEKRVERIEAKLDNRPVPPEQTWKEFFSDLAGSLGCLGFIVLLLGIWWVVKHQGEAEAFVKKWLDKWFGFGMGLLCCGFFCFAFIRICWLYGTDQWEKARTPQTSDFLHNHPKLTIALAGLFAIGSLALFVSAILSEWR
jgi:hypothetical protein